MTEGDLTPETSRHTLVPLKVAYKKLRMLVDVGCVFLGHGLKKDFRIISECQSLEGEEYMLKLVPYVVQTFTYHNLRSLTRSIYSNRLHILASSHYASCLGFYSNKTFKALILVRVTTLLKMLWLHSSCISFIFNSRETIV